MKKLLLITQCMLMLCVFGAGILPASASFPSNVSGILKGFSTAMAITPVVSTDSSNNITGTSAYLYGTVNAQGNTEAVIFEYGTTTSFGSTVTAIQSPVSGTNNTFVSANITGLIPNTTYYFNVIATDSFGTTTGSLLMFTTLALAPVTTTNSAASILSTSAILMGTVNANNSSTSVTFEWGTTASYGNMVTAAQSPVSGILNSTVSTALSGLNPHTTYHFRVDAANTGGTTFGSDAYFTTAGVAPYASTDSSITTGSTTANIYGTVNAKYDTATVTFLYGTTASYGNTVTAGQSPLTGSTNTFVSASLSGLYPNTIYHYKVSATNSTGTTAGVDKIFITFSVPPVATTDTASSIISNGAILNGHVNVYNMNTTVSFQWGTTTSYGNTIYADQSPVSGYSIVPVTATLSSLQPNTIYHFRIVAANLAGTSYGNDISFFTAAVPLTATDSATSVTSSTATINGNVNALNTSAIVVFQWGTGTSYGNTATAVQSPVTGNSNTQVSFDLQNLDPNTTYHYIATATNVAGTAYGNDISFTTSAVAPVAKTDSTGDIQSGSATLYGSVNAYNLSTDVTFEYGTTTSYGSTVYANQSPLNTGNNMVVSVVINGLLPNTLYHFRVDANNTLGSAYGNDMTFITGIALPDVVTGTASSITPFTAVIDGNVNANNDTTLVQFQYGKTTAYGNTITVAQSPVTGMLNTYVNASLSGIEPNTVYHFRLTATNSEGTINGNDTSFITLSTLPMATTGGAINIGGTGATLTGTVNAENLSTTVIFEYGTSVSYGNDIAATQSPLNGSVDTYVDLPLTGLAPNTTYHFRVVANNAEGTILGNDTTFTTNASSPVALTNAASNITYTSAVLNGTVNPDDNTTGIYFEYGTSLSYGNSVVAAQSPLNGFGNSAVNYTLTGLTPNTVYHYRVVAESITDTIYGMDTAFMTQAEQPKAITGNASGIGINQALLNAVVNANNQVTIITFEYGFTYNYGMTVNANPALLNGSADSSVSVNITGLNHSITYHFRVVAVNAAGTTYGNDNVFIASDSTPAVSTSPVTSIAASSASGGGNITDDGGQPVIKRGVCWSISPNPDTTLSTRTNDGANPGTFISNITGLSSSTTYYLRAYAVNSVGISYGNEISFSTLYSGIDEQTANGSVKIYSFSKNAVVKFSADENVTGQVFIMNLEGKVIIRKEITGNYNTFDLSNYPDGYYIINVFAKGNSYSAKVRIE